MDPEIGIPGGDVVLYKCPYCKDGRFTKNDGWDSAVKHIKERHVKENNGSRRSRRNRHSHDTVDSSNTNLFDRGEVED